MTKKGNDDDGDGGGGGDGNGCSCRYVLVSFVFAVYSVFLFFLLDQVLLGMVENKKEYKIETQRSMHVKNSSVKVLFYLYPFEDFPLSWGSCDHERVFAPKHDHAQFVWQGMMQHSQRTNDPEKAQIAFIPLELDVRARAGCKAGTQHQIQNEVKNVLLNSSIFPSIRHVFLATDEKAAPIGEAIFQLLQPAGIWIGMEGRGECRSSLGYTSTYATSMSLRQPAHVQIPNQFLGSDRIYTLHMTGQVKEQPGYEDRLALFRALNKTQGKGIPSPYITTVYDQNVPLHQTFRHCDLNGTNTVYLDGCLDHRLDRLKIQLAQERSNFTLCLRGGALGSDAWINGMTAGTALIQVADEGEEHAALQWLPFQAVVPWKDLVITIPRKKFLEDPIKAIRHVLDTTSEKRLLELQHLSLRYAADVDWTTYHSRVLDNLITESYNVPCQNFTKRQQEQQLTRSVN